MIALIDKPYYTKNVQKILGMLSKRTQRINLDILKWPRTQNPHSRGMTVLTKYFWPHRNNKTKKKELQLHILKSQNGKKNILLGSFIDIFLFKPMREFVFAILTIPFKYPQQTKNRRIVHPMNNFCTRILSHRIYLKGLSKWTISLKKIMSSNIKKIYQQELILSPNNLSYDK